MPIEKNDDSITSKMPAALKRQITMLANLEGLTASEFMRNLGASCVKEKIDLMKTLQEVFSDEQGNMVYEVNHVSEENRSRLMRLAAPSKELH